MVSALNVPSYTDEGIGVVLQLCERIQSAFSVAASPVLVSKTMLGVFGCMPTFERYFSLGFEGARLNRGTLSNISNFYAAHSDVLRAVRIPTIDFTTGQDTSRCYTQ